MCFVCITDHWMDPHSAGHSHFTLVWKGKVSAASKITGFCFHYSKSGNIIVLLSNFPGRDPDQPRPHCYIPSPHHNNDEPVQRDTIPPLLQQPQRPRGGEACSWRKHQRQDPQVSKKNPTFSHTFQLSLIVHVEK